MALTLDEKECKSAEWPMLKQAMKSSNMPSSIRKEVREGPSRCKGLLNCHPLCFTRGTQQIKALQEHGHEKTLTRKLL